MASDLRSEPWMAALDALRAEADQLAALLGGAVRTDTVHAGDDSSGAVRVTMTGAGQVSNVDLAEWWRTALTADRLGGAVLEAITDATARRLAAWVAAVAEGTVPAATRATERPADPSALPSADHVLPLLDAVEGGLQHAAEWAGREVTGHGGDRTVTVTVRGGEVVRVDLDRRWLATAGCSTIVAELRAAFAAAYRMAEEGPAEPSPIAELRALAAGMLDGVHPA